MAKSFLYIKNGVKVTKVLHNSIDFIEVDGRYLRVVCNDNTKLIVTSSLKDIMTLMPSFFIKVHQSFAVNENQIDYVDFKTNTIVLESGCKIPFNRSFKKYINACGLK